MIMNENLNLVEILKDCPEGTKLYSPIYGDVELIKVCQHSNNSDYPIEIRLSNNSTDDLTMDGRLYEEFDGECMLFPSNEQRDWSKFKPKKPKFDPKTLHPFDRVLVRDNKRLEWFCNYFSHIEWIDTDYPFVCTDSSHRMIIPYNDDTKHLVGTTEEAPEFYRYWED